MTADGSVRRVGLVGCVKEKAASARPAQDLYLSTLFLGRRRYVERSCDEWWILSALHGLLHPDACVEPYDVTLNGAGRAAKRAWSRHVLEQVDDSISLRAGDIVELHCGAEYRDFGLVDGLLARGMRVENPTEGLRIGAQLRFYKDAGP